MGNRHIKKEKGSKLLNNKRVIIFGSGVVGYATGRCLIEKGKDVIFVDTNDKVVEKLREKGHLAFKPAETNYLEEDSAVIMISVPTYTPYEDCKKGLDAIRKASVDIGALIEKSNGYSIVVVRSTIMPGTTEVVIVPIIERSSGKKAGRDFGICVNPELLRERTAEMDFSQPWVIVIGELDRKSGDVLEQEVYWWANCPIHRLSIKQAELHKVVHNLFNATKISFFNEVRVLCEKLSLDCDEVFRLVVKSAEASWNPEYGILDKGPFGGKCLPKDMAAFLSWTEDKGEYMPLTNAVRQVNQSLLAQRELTR